LTENKVTGKRELILQAALKVFSDRGFHKAKIEEIAQEAGVGKGTVYEYFTSKKQLFQEMLKDRIETFNEHIKDAVEKEKSTRGKLLCIIKESIIVGRHFRHLNKMALLETTLIDESFRHWLLDMHAYRLSAIGEILQEGIDKGELKPLNVSLFARLFYGGLGTLVSPIAGMDMTQIDVDKTAGEIVDLYLQGVAQTQVT
jgi:TetR/AcrR family fatty acid metabolism transcriptional regulator